MLFRVDRSDHGESFLAAPVVSPIDGWIGRWAIDTIGAQVTTQDPVVTVVDDVALRATVYMPASDWLHVRKDTPVKVTLEGATRDGRILTIARSAAAASSRGSVIVEVDNAAHDWRAGLVARIVFEVDRKQRRLVPAQALTVTDRGAYIYLVEGDKAKRTEVEFVVVNNDTVELTKGVTETAFVVVAGANNLADGAFVRVTEDSKPTEPPMKAASESTPQEPSKVN